jgi:acid phosphatase
MAQRSGAGWRPGWLGAWLAITALVATLNVLAPALSLADDCPKKREPRLPESKEPVTNIDKFKKQLLAYQAGDYADDVALVIADARAYVERRADQVKMPAVVLDIDETSLSNWENIKDNNFGFIKSGPCTQEPDMACGFDEWIQKAIAPAIEPTRTFFNALRARNISVFFITGRRNSQRDATLINLDHAGFEGWTRLITRPDTHSGSIVPFKSGERARIASAGYTIIATIGDQQSDIDGGFAECGFKLPNPFYFIE